MSRIFTIYPNTLKIFDCKSFVAFEHSSRYSVYVNSRHFSATNLCNGDFAISSSIAGNFAVVNAIISGLLSPSCTPTSSILSLTTSCTSGFLQYIRIICTRPHYLMPFIPKLYLCLHQLYTHFMVLILHLSCINHPFHHRRRLNTILTQPCIPIIFRLLCSRFLLKSVHPHSA